MGWRNKGKGNLQVLAGNRVRIGKLNLSKELAQVITWHGNFREELFR